MSVLAALGFFISFLSVLLAIGLAVFVLTRSPRAWANRWLAIGLTILGVHQTIMLAATLAAPGPLRFGLLRFGLAVASLISPIWLAFSLTFGETNGGVRLARWRPALAGLGLVVPVTWSGLALGRIIQPLRVGVAEFAVFSPDAWGRVFFSIYIIGLSLVLLHLENLYRHATRTIRWKIKFLVVGLFVAFAYQIVAASYVLLYGFVHPLYSIFGSLAFLVGEAMIAFSLVRHRLLDVDIFISRYVVHRSLTLALVGAYLLSLGLAAELFTFLNVHLDMLSGTLLAIIGAAALSLLLLSEHLRRTVQRFLHTHFYSHKYDYRVEWMGFTHRLSRASSIPEIATQTLNRILEVMWVKQAALYVQDNSPARMTLAHHVEYDALPKRLDLTDATRETLKEEANRLASAAGVDDPAGAADSLARTVFGEIPVGYLIPVWTPESVAALLLVGPELSGKPFGRDDRDLLVAVAAQAGALIVNARLAQQAAEGRELQILARLSASIAHDLKNSVGMLSMLAENAPQHMHDPAFQSDAIRTIVEVTGRMQRLLAALGRSDNRPTARATRAGLSALVETSLRDLKTMLPPRIALGTLLDHTPDVVMDPEQLRTVLVNLVLNAIEAIPGEGRITVETRAENGWAILVVTDTGRGMPADFVRDRLFRPFQTTKRSGLGIGLFQCRDIIQALGGDLTADSQEGVGTRMTIRLPAASGSHNGKPVPSSRMQPAKG